MTGDILTVLGGIGLFLVGMKIMTEALRDAAGSGLRDLLTRFTTTPLRGTLTGIGATALIQSSTATSVMTVGFVGAGLMSFPQALGVLYGANIGTTVTGWIVTFLGLKLQIGLLAQPVLFVAALAMVLGRGRPVRVAKGVAGAAMLFIGLDLMQGAATLAEGWITPDRLPGDSPGGRLMLIGLGFALVSVVQSSSAGMAITLVLLGGGAITFAQAAAITIGLNIGTTITALLAALGGGRAMRQTALANLLFNVVTAALAFPLLDGLAPLLHATAAGQDDLTALVLFHTGFNVAGALLFLPLTPRFAALLDHLVPEGPAGLAAGLDPTLRAEPEAALAAAEKVGADVARVLFAALGSALPPDPDLRPLATLPQQVPDTLEKLETYLAAIRLPEGQRALHDRFAALLHALDHLQRFHARLERHSPLDVIGSDARLRRAAVVLAGRLRAPQTSDAQFQRLAGLIDRRARIYRQRTLQQRLAGAKVQDLFDRTDAMRWLARLADHAAAIARYMPPD